MSSSQSSLLLAVEGLSFGYDTASSPLFENLQFEVASSWTGICGANGAGKSTLLKLLVHQLVATSGTIQCSAHGILCEQRTDFLPLDARDFIEDYSADSYRIRVNLGIEDEWIDRWDTLSHGERKRLQVGTALWSEPKLLLLDEPTNHLDSESGLQMVRALKKYTGIGMIVTHDRALLDELCEQCLWFQPPMAPSLRPGGYTRSKASIDLELKSQTESLEQLQRENKRLTRTAHLHRREATQADRKLSNRGIDSRDNDARNKRNMALVSGKDGVAGKRLRQMEGRLRQLQETKDSIRVQKSFEMGIWMDFEVTHRNLVFSCDARGIKLGPEGQLELPRIELRPHQQIVLRGPNGAGKSTLLSQIVQHHKLTREELLYLPQEISAAEATNILRVIKEFPKDELGKLMQIVRRLGSNPGRVLESEIPSPGELRKLLFAIGILKRPAFLILDEPTNHLDLPSIECLQSALVDCPTGFLLVSHDLQFCDALSADTWEIVNRGEKDYVLQQV